MIKTDQFRPLSINSIIEKMLNIMEVCFLYKIKFMFQLNFFCAELFYSSPEHCVCVILRWYVGFWGHRGLSEGYMLFMLITLKFNIYSRIEWLSLCYTNSNISLIVLSHGLYFVQERGKCPKKREKCPSIKNVPF